jgi:hypothetical protein
MRYPSCCDVVQPMVVFLVCELMDSLCTFVGKFPVRFILLDFRTFGTIEWTFQQWRYHYLWNHICLFVPFCTLCVICDWQRKTHVVHACSMLCSLVSVLIYSMDLNIYLTICIYIHFVPRQPTPWLAKELTCRPARVMRLEWTGGRVSGLPKIPTLVCPLKTLATVRGWASMWGQALSTPDLTT